MLNENEKPGEQETDPHSMEVDEEHSSDSRKESDLQSEQRGNAGERFQGSERERGGTRDKKQSCRDEAEAERRFSPIHMATGVSISVTAPESFLPVVDSGIALDPSQTVLPSRVEDHGEDVQLRLCESGVRRSRDVEREPGEITDGSEAEEGELEVEGLTEVLQRKFPHLPEIDAEELLLKKRKYSPIVWELQEKQARSKVSSDSPLPQVQVTAVLGDGASEIVLAEPRDKRTEHVDGSEGRKKSKSRKSSRKSSRHHKESEDVIKRSKSRESEVAKARSRGTSIERNRRSRSRDSVHNRKADDRDKSRNVGWAHERSHGDERPRKSRAVSPEKKRRRSRSRESMADRRGDDGRDMKRHGDGSEETLNRNHRRDHSSGRHCEQAIETHDRNHKDSRTKRLTNSIEREGPSRSKGSLADLKSESRLKVSTNGVHERSHRSDLTTSRHGANDTNHRSHRDAQDRWNGSLRKGGRDRMYGADQDRDRRYSNRHERDSGIERDHKQVLKVEAKQGSERTAREEENQEEYQERVESQLAAQEEDDVERIKEESRRRRQAILEKYSQQQKTDREHLKKGVESEDHSVQEAKVPVGATVPSQKDGKTIVAHVHAVEVPTASVSLEQGHSENGASGVQILAGVGDLGAGTPKGEHSSDMFCDDIFGESPAGGRRVGKGDGPAIDTSCLTDNWDDAEGRYCFRIGEILDNRYEVLSSHGSGVFSTVVRARDTKAGGGDPEEVAIKIIRNNETMFRTGQQELVILRKLAGADPENRRHCVRLLSSFEYRNHLCLVFESLHMNLREVLKKFGRNIGINLSAVRAYAKQLFIALKHLRNCGVLHCDIKPDNMLVNDAKNVLKLCDFGSAMFAGENEITPYLVSRFYRAPEIILGLPYDHALDVWSVGCCLYELYSGKMLFPGHTNNDMLRLQMELKGSFPKKLLKKASFADQHFDQDYNFCSIEEDPVTKKMVKRILVNVRPKDMGVLVASSGTADEDSKTVAQFKDFLEKIFILDPDKRITVSQALNHPFISGK